MLLSDPRRGDLLRTGHVSALTYIISALFVLKRFLIV